MSYKKIKTKLRELGLLIIACKSESERDEGTDSMCETTCMADFKFTEYSAPSDMLTWHVHAAEPPAFSSDRVSLNYSDFDEHFNRTR
jgi:hypothetical protein